MQPISRLRSFLILNSRRALKLALYSVCVVGQFCQPANGSGDDDSGVASVSAEVESLVVQLSANTFAEREEAMHRLIDLSGRAFDQVAAVEADEDRELRARRKTILARIAKESRPERLRSFAAGADLTGNMRLPCWDDFQELIEDERMARRVWTRVLAKEWDFLARVESAHGDTENVLHDRLLQMNSNRAWHSERAPHDSVIALMVASIANQATVADHVSMQIYGLLNQVQQPTSDSLDFAWNQPAFREIVGNFILATDGRSSTHQGLTLAMRHNLDRCGLEAAERVIRGGEALPHVRQYAILTMARFGGKEHAPTLHQLLDDSGVFFSGKVRGSKQQKIECQVRDLALASLIHLTGGDPRAAGFQHLQLNSQFVFLPHTVGFTTDDERKAAFAAVGEVAGEADGVADDAQGRDEALGS